MSIMETLTTDKYGFIVPVWKINNDDMSQVEKEISDAIWAGDIEKLNSIAECNCLSKDSYTRDCRARSWNGCKGQHGEDLLYINAKYSDVY